MNPYVIAGAVVGGLWLLDNKPVGATQAGATQAQRAGSAITAAMQVLLAKRPIAGVSWAQDPEHPLSATANYGQMRDAFVGKFGRLPGATVAPSGLTADQLVELMTAWLAAYDAGRSANHTNFGLVQGETSTPTNAAELAWKNVTCSQVGNSPIGDNGLSPIGTAACALSRYRDYIGNADSDAAANALVHAGEATIESFRLVNALASEMDGADYVTPGVANDQQGWKWSDIPGGVEAAAEASASAVGGLAGDVAGYAGNLVLGSNLIWLVVLGGALYFVMR